MSVLCAGAVVNWYDNSAYEFCRGKCGTLEFRKYNIMKYFQIVGVVVVLLLLLLFRDYAENNVSHKTLIWAVHNKRRTEAWMDGLMYPLRLPALTDC